MYSQYISKALYTSIEAIDDDDRLRAIAKASEKQNYIHTNTYY